MSKLSQATVMYGKTEATLNWEDNATTCRYDVSIKYIISLISPAVTVILRTNSMITSNIPATMEAAVINASITGQ